MPSGEFQRESDSIRRHVAHVLSSSIVDLRRCSGPLTEHTRLTSHVKQELGKCDRNLAELGLVAEDELTERQRQDARDTIAEIKANLEEARNVARAATLVSKRMVDEQAFSRRRQLLYVPSSALRTSSSTDSPKDDTLVSATAQVTDKLRDTVQMMQQELDRSLLSSQMLEQSTQTLSLTSNQYSTFSSLLATSKQLITHLEQGDLLDRLIIVFSLLLFGLCCLLILKRRVFDKGINLALAMANVFSLRSRTPPSKGFYSSTEQPQPTLAPMLTDPMLQVEEAQTFQGIRTARGTEYASDPEALTGINFNELEPETPGEAADGIEPTQILEGQQVELVQHQEL